MSVTVVGSVNLDVVAELPRLPERGETLIATGLTRLPGSKGANQALAARRLGLSVRLLAAVGTDPEADAALELLRREGVTLDRLQRVIEPTGLALIALDTTGETIIVVVPGANAALQVNPQDVVGADAVLTVLEVPEQAVIAAALAGLLRELPDAELLARACAAGALAATRLGAQPSLPTAAEIDEVLAR